MKASILAGLFCICFVVNAVSAPYQVRLPPGQVMYPPDFVICYCGHLESRGCVNGVTRMSQMSQRKYGPIDPERNCDAANKRMKESGAK